ncbi:hypothetical protein P7M25_09660 [Vibrio parahaemolyticus]|nr:hypothetical protein [Vibrio parahaemolyticus]
MANTEVKKLIDEAARLVVDPQMIRWSKEFWVDAYNSAVRAIVAIRPDALTKTLIFTCVQGSTQKVPEGTRYVVDVVRNKDGRAVSGNINLKMLNDYRPDWRIEEPAPEVKGWFYDERNPSDFYVYPPAQAGVELEIAFAMAPIPIVTGDYDANTPSELISVYDNAITEWLVYRAFSEDSEFTANAGRAANSLNAFRTILGDKAQADAVTHQKSQDINNAAR